jgi:RNA polymerase sigma-70 factor (ECF subfamily)
MHVQSATNFAYKCGDDEAALDLVQDAFTKIWENCSKIDFSKVKTYLFTSINNLFLNNINIKSGIEHQRCA